MATVAVMLADGFEEIEALTPVDVLRRANIACDTVGLTDQKVTGSHAIPVLADKVFDGDLSAYDMIVLPGGLPGAHHLRDHEGLIAALGDRDLFGADRGAIGVRPVTGHGLTQGVAAQHRAVKMRIGLVQRRLGHGAAQGFGGRVDGRRLAEVQKRPLGRKADALDPAPRLHDGRPRG